MDVATSTSNPALLRETSNKRLFCGSFSTKRMCFVGITTPQTVLDTYLEGILPFAQRKLSLRCRKVDSFLQRRLSLCSQVLRADRLRRLYDRLQVAVREFQVEIVTAADLSSSLYEYALPLMSVSNIVWHE